MTARSGARSDGRSPTCPAASIDDGDAAVERGAQVGEDAPTRRRGVAGTEDDHVTGTQDRLQRAHGAAPVAQVGTVLQQVFGGQIEVDLHGAVFEPAAVDQPDVSEDPLHAGVVRERLGDEAAEAGLAGDAGEVLEQHRGDTLLVMGVGDGEGHLGLLAAGPGVVLTDGDELAVGVDHQRHMVADVLLGRPPQLGLGDDGRTPKKRK